MATSVGSAIEIQMIAKISRYEDARKNGVYQYCVTWNERFNQKMFGQGRVSFIITFVVPWCTGEGIDSRLLRLLISRYKMSDNDVDREAKQLPTMV